ncbi:MAG TPA: amidohydrolase family protein [Thermoanaerobaculia bacterium]|nr:amidohydrolase family protein [Thermoanaerobaculia bacterium]
MRNKPACLVVYALLLVLAFACGSAHSEVPRSAAVTAPKSAGEEARYTVLFGGNPAGALVVRQEGSEVVSTYEFNDRGRGPKLQARTVLGEGGVPVRVEITGNEYWKKPVDERFELAGGGARWNNGAETGERRLTAPAYYLPLNVSPDDLARLAAALLAAPDRRLPLLPDGEARIESAGSAEIRSAEGVRTVHLYALSGLDFGPTYLWLDADRRLFAVSQSWTTIVRTGREGVMADLVGKQEEAASKSEKEMAARYAKRPAGALAITNARLFDSETGATSTGTTVLVSGSRIQAVGHDGEVAIPAGAEVIDARGRTLLPGLWDMHTHLGTTDGILNLAAGVTSVRDLANDTDFLLGLKHRFETGETLGPRIVMAGFIDSPGPYAGPSKVLVSTEAEALAAVDRYAELGYVQIKVYSSLDLKLLPPIVERAHRLGLRVSGHIPNGMTAEQAVRAGFDEIHHSNFLFLNFMEGIDTRTPARFLEVGAHGAELDTGSEPVRSFLGLLKERHVVIDPTLTPFEDIFLGRPGVIGSHLAAVADRLPPQVRRGLLAGGVPKAEGMEQRYRDSFRNMLRMVRALYDTGVTIVAGTDTMPGFGLHRELELYVEAGLPAPDVLRIATLGAARVARRDKDLGTIAPGKLADLILVDGDPVARISDIRRVVLTVKDGVLYDPAELYPAIGVKPMR